MMRDDSGEPISAGRAAPTGKNAPPVTIYDLQRARLALEEEVIAAERARLHRCATLAQIRQASRRRARHG